MRLLAAALVALLVAAPAAAQSLAEAAKREKQRREKVEKSAQPAAKSYTDTDLKAPRGATATEGAPPTQGTSASGSSQSSGEQGEDTGAEEQWRSRAAEHRKRVSDAEQRIQELKVALERARVDREPPGANVMDPFREQTRQAEIGRLQSQISIAESRLQRARQELAEFEEEARRAGIPPGWVRQP